MSIAEQLQQGRRDIELPAALVLAGGERMQCEEMLRLFPGKRAVMRARWRGRATLVKLLLDTPSGRRNARRERAGYDALRTAGLPTPELLSASRCADGHHVLAFAFIERAHRLGDWARAAADAADAADPAGRLDAAALGLRMLARLHRNACGHTDPHLDNFILAGELVYVVDVGSIARRPNTGYGRWRRNNLAFFLAQFAPLQRARLLALLPAHYAEAATDPKLQRAIARAWRRRIARYMKKCVRDCSDFAAQTTWRQTAVWNRALYGDDLADFLRDPDAYIANGALLKDGNSATVARARMDGRTVVIKRNNIKDAGHGLRRCLRATRSRVNWQGAHLLRLNGIATPAPVAFVERRRGPLRLGGYYVCAFCDAPSAAEKYRDAPPRAQELAWFETLFAGMRLAQICHGDFKASNLLVTGNGVSLLDLDSMKAHARAATYRQCAAKDRRRFLQNWKDQPPQREAFAEILAKTDGVV
ncbi:MAG: hypothetical protein OXU98_07420 [Gammaproteobacteria bacterium]|nr:hypothetical protein [Gammaproteobacteria bacterium]